MRYLSLKEAAELLGVHPDTVRRRIAEGSLPACRTGGTFGHWRVSLDDLTDAVIQFHQAARTELGAPAKPAPEGETMR